MAAIRPAIRSIVGPWAAAGASLAFAAGLFALRPDLALVEHVVFVGADYAPSAELRHASQVRNGTRMWEIWPQAVAKRVEAHPWVERAEVALVWPNTLLIRVKEHEPLAVLHHGGTWYVDASGVVFAEADPDHMDLPHLTGLTPDLAELHPDLPAVALASAVDLLLALEAKGLVHPADVSEIHFSRTAGWTVTVGPSRLLFGLGGRDRQLDHLGALMMRKPDLTARSTEVDLAPRQLAVVRPHLSFRPL